MIVETKHGSFEVKEINRKERRKFYKKVKGVGQDNDIEKLHDLGDEFASLAFGDEKKAEKALEGLSAIQEDEVLSEIIGAYMGFNLGNPSGD